MPGFNRGDVGVNLDGAHGRIHQGQFFIASEFNIVAAASVLYYLMSTNEKSAHFAFDMATNGDLQISFHKQVVASVIGTVVPAINANDFSTLESTAIITKGATITDEGIQWECMLIVSGPGQSSSSQMVNSRLEEFILKTNDFYALKIENLTNQEIEICTRIGWYEPET